jgi:hypothetical protein
VDRSIAEGLASTPEAVPIHRRRSDVRWGIAVGLALAALALVVYGVSNPNRYNFYAHFTWQAQAWLEGEAGIRWPVCSPFHPAPDCVEYAPEHAPYNEYYRDLLPIVDAQGNPTGRALIPFPPLPAVVLLPFVALWGLATDAQALAAILGAVDVALVWWMLGGLRLRETARVAVTLFFAFGTVFWYTAKLGTTWYFAHVVAVALTVLAVGLTLRRDRDAVEAALEDAHGLEPRDPEGLPTLRDLLPSSLARVRTAFDGRMFLAGLCLGLACLARLPILFGFPFLLLVGGRGGFRRAFSAGLGTALPVLGLVGYNLATTGHVFHPAYEYLYRLEAVGYPHLNYHPEWSIEDIRYIPQNLALMLFGMPSVMPDCVPTTPRGLFNEDCPIAVPIDVGMSLVLTSPAYLLAIPALRGFGRTRLVTGAVLAVVLIAVLNLMHFSQGWVQFGYRFSNDFAPFALLLVGLGIVRLGGIRWFVALLIGLSIAVNLWGVIWGNLLGW